MHQSLYRNEMENFQKYWMHNNILGKLQNDKIVLFKKYLTIAMMELVNKFMENCYC
jgi:hypothetical protein